MNKKNIIIGLTALVATMQPKITVANTLATVIDSADVTKPVAPLVPLDMQRVAEVAAMLPLTPQGFGDTYHNRLAWGKLYSNVKYHKVISTAEALLNKPFPAWNDAAYLMYFTKGTRPEGEKMMGNRLGWLAPLVWAECLENKGRFVPTIQMVLNELIHQKSWSLPAHDKKKQNIDGRNYTVDLGAAGFAHNVAQAVYLLDDKLTPQLRADVLAEMEKHVFKPVLQSVATGNNNSYWLTVTSNWNSVCLAGVTGAALAIIPDREERGKFVTIAERYAKNSVAGFTNEGYCTEGLGYYDYGFSKYILLRENIWQATNKTINLFADPKIKRIASYVPNLEIINNVYPNIADCHVGVKAPAALLWYCSRNLGLGLQKYDSLTFAGGTATLTDDVMRAFPNSASQSKVNSNTSALAFGLRSYFKQAGVLIERPLAGSKANIGAALKGGNNNEIHNHNDVGSFSVVVGDEMLMGDPGGPSFYTAKTFGPERYSYKLLSSYGHPVPLVAGVEQQEGAASEAKVLNATFTDKQDEFVMDISSAYPVPALSKLVRTFTYNRDDAGFLTVKDDFAFKTNQKFEFTLITRAQWKQIAPNQIEFDGKTQKMIATISTKSGFAVKAETIVEDAPAFKRIGIVLPPAEAGAITVTFRPVK
ncbi:heparinase II/III-like protein [Mucilaginibacter gracilis]|uniref:Heparinase II/III-like protein n=1 Tax=Mucilaginibacter gracilis TaxID=423350 RepID=A0A495ITN1_9SPHI|nr:heparinase II/III family protein [Mucilaginibacter gracilis]RKR80126.1 heparinase II/III-like protein [Mucilaginibacter gracilis]